MIALYIWIFYFFFVGPTGFRWRALYGDASYPEGCEIHGIDISHYQGNIDWEALQNAMIEGCPVRFILSSLPKVPEDWMKISMIILSGSRLWIHQRGLSFWSNKSSAREQAYYF